MFNLKKFSIVICLAALLFQSCSGPKAEKDAAAQEGHTKEKELLAMVTRFKGRVHIIRNGKVFRVSQPGPGARLFKGDKIQTMSDAAVDIKFIGRGVTQLKSQTLIIINELSAVKSINIKMEKGKALLALKKLSKDQSFEVITPTAVAGVRGTSFMLDASSRQTKISVLTGKVAVGNNKKAPVIVDAKKETVVTTKTVAAPVRIKGVSLDAVKSLLSIEGVEEVDDFSEMKSNIKQLEILDKKSLNEDVSVDRELDTKKMSTTQKDVSVETRKVTGDSADIQNKSSRFDSDDDLMTK
jgi:hypothetical protein